MKTWCIVPRRWLASLLTAPFAEADWKVAESSMFEWRADGSEYLPKTYTLCLLGVFNGVLAKFDRALVLLNEKANWRLRLVKRSAIFGG